MTITIRLAARAVAAVVVAGLLGCAQPTPPPPPVAYTPPVPQAESRVILSIYFDFDSHRIRPDSFATLDNTAVALINMRNEGYRFEVNGHTDVIGRLGYNIGLSMLRAAAVVDYLVARDVPPGSMRPQGFGPLQLANPSNPAGAENRRVEIVALRP